MVRALALMASTRFQHALRDPEAAKGSDDHKPEQRLEQSAAENLAQAFAFLKIMSDDKAEAARQGEDAG